MQSGTVMKSVGPKYLSHYLGMNYSTTSYLYDLGQITESKFLICKMGIIVVLTSQNCCENEMRSCTLSPLLNALYITSFLVRVSYYQYYLFTFQLQGHLIYYFPQFFLMQYSSRFTFSILIPPKLQQCTDHCHLDILQRPQNQYIPKQMHIFPKSVHVHIQFFTKLFKFYLNIFLKQPCFSILNVIFLALIIFHLD